MFFSLIAELLLLRILALSYRRSSTTIRPFSCVSTEIDQCISHEDLRSWILRKTTIDPSHQILMTARGKQVKLQTLLSEVRSPTCNPQYKETDRASSRRSFFMIEGYLLPRPQSRVALYFQNQPFQTLSLQRPSQTARQPTIHFKDGKHFSSIGEHGQLH